MTLRIGTRGSQLARWQADWVAAQLSAAGVPVELVMITTQGDARQTGPIGALGGQGVFTKEIQQALLDDRVDLAVHSLKDLPTDSVEGLSLAAVPPRESVADVLVTREAPPSDKNLLLEALPDGARVGTGSLRRRAQLLHARSDLVVDDIRGNVDTRLRKLDDDEYAAIVLAEAGLRRLGLESRITQVLPAALMLSAVGQGALGIETRTDDSTTREALAPLDDPATHRAVLAERALLRHLRGGCLAPVGGWARMADDRLFLQGVVLSADGAERLTAEAHGAPDRAESLGESVAQSLIEQGARELIAASRDA
jgi:hydroxymethylbilane synthase